VKRNVRIAPFGWFDCFDWFGRLTTKKLTTKKLRTAQETI
jgi:hypothetical protein